MATSIRGWNALLTGATFGLGPYIARRLADAGANVALASRTTERLDAIAAELKHKGVRAVTIPTDLRDPAAREALVSRARSELGEIDILVNAAGLMHAGRLQKRTPREIEELLEVNLVASMLLTRMLLPGMLERGRGRIVQVASIAGKGGAAYLSLYAASKHGLVGFTHALQGELHGTGVHASVVCPGFMSGEGMWGRAKRRIHPLFGVSSPDRVARAVVTMIRRRQVEVVVNPLPIRYAFAMWTLMPRPTAAIFRLTGVAAFLRGFALQSEAESEQKSDTCESRPTT